MSLPKLYLETTIPSYLTAQRSRDLRLAADQETTEEWWETQRNEYELFISEAVLDEASALAKPLLPRGDWLCLPDCRA